MFDSYQKLELRTFHVLTSKYFILYQIEALYMCKNCRKRQHKMPRQSVPYRSSFITDWNGHLLDKRVVDFLRPGCIVRIMLDDLRPGYEGHWNIVYGKIYKIKDGTFWARQWIELNPCGCDYYKTMHDSSEDLRKRRRKNRRGIFDVEAEEEEYLPDIDYKKITKDDELEDRIFEADLNDHIEHDKNCPWRIVDPDMKLTFRRNNIKEIPIHWQPRPAQKAIARANLRETDKTTWPFTGGFNA